MYRAYINCWNQLWVHIGTIDPPGTSDSTELWCIHRVRPRHVRVMIWGWCDMFHMCPKCLYIMYRAYINCWNQLWVHIGTIDPPGTSDSTALWCIHRVRPRHVRVMIWGWCDMFHMCPKCLYIMYRGLGLGLVERRRKNPGHLVLMNIRHST